MNAWCWGACVCVCVCVCVCELVLSARFFCKPKTVLKTSLQTAINAHEVQHKSCWFITPLIRFAVSV